MNMDVQDAQDQNTAMHQGSALAAIQILSILLIHV